MSPLKWETLFYQLMSDIKVPTMPPDMLLFVISFIFIPSPSTVGISLAWVSTATFYQQHFCLWAEYVNKLLAENKPCHSSISSTLTLCFGLEDGTAVSCVLLSTRPSSAVLWGLIVGAFITCPLIYPVHHHELFSKTKLTYLTTFNPCPQEDG